MKHVIGALTAAVLIALPLAALSQPATVATVLDGGGKKLSKEEVSRLFYGAGIVTETGFGRASWWGRLPAWSSSPTADIASRRRSSSTRFGYTSGSH
jgi:hypothetical protein